MTIRSRTVRLPAVLAVALIAATAGPAAAAAPAVAPAQAYVRAAHFSPDTGGVDVYLTAFSGGTNALWLSNVGYGDVSPYRAVAAGDYAVSMRPHGAAATTPAVLTWSLDLSAGATYTAAAVGINSQLHGVVIPDSLTAPAAGTALARVIQASSQAGHVAVQIGGTVITADTAFGASSSYVSVPAGSVTAQATSSTQPALTASSPVTLASGSVTSLIVLDQASGGLTLRTVTDAAGAQTMPSGSVPAGGGGTAHGQSSPVAAWVAFGAAILVALTFIRPRRRRASAA